MKGCSFNDVALIPDANVLTLELGVQGLEGSSVDFSVPLNQTNLNCSTQRSSI